MPTKRLYISWATVYKKGDAAEVRGVIRRRHRGFYSAHGHIDIAVVAPDGTVLEETNTLYHPRILRRKGVPRARFTASMSTVPPPGSTVRLSYHEDKNPYSVSKPFSCDTNAALPDMKESRQ
jgi:hypothetical protein